MRKNFKHTIFYAAAGVIALFILYALIRQLSLPDRFVQLFQAPLSAGWSIKENVLRLMRPNKISQEDYDSLIARLNEDRSERSYCEKLEQENTALRKVLDLKKVESGKMIHAEIFGNSIVNDARVIILNKGSRDGVVVGSAAVSPDGAFVGTISSVEPSISFLLFPIDDQKGVIGSIFKNGSEIIGIVRGKFRLGIVVEKMQQTQAVASGDSVVTSQLNARIPQGLLIGTIREVMSTANDLFQQATLTPAVTYDSLRIVTIISK